MIWENVPDWASLELSPSVESCGCGLGLLPNHSPLPLPQSPKDCSIHLCLFCCLVYRVARASSAKTRGFHTQLDEGPETP